MARNDNVKLVKDVWTQLTNGNVTALRATNTGKASFVLQATVGTTAPTSAAGGIPLDPGQTLAADLTVAQLWPGVTGANRIWGLSEQAGIASVSHANA